MVGTHGGGRMRASSRWDGLLELQGSMLTIRPLRLMVLSRWGRCEPVAA